MSTIVTQMKTAKTASRTTTISQRCAIDYARADRVDRQHSQHDCLEGEDAAPATRGVVADEQRRRVAAERDRHHRAHDHDRREVAQPRGDPHQAAVSEPLDQIRDQPARGGEPHSEARRPCSQAVRPRSQRAGTTATRPPPRPHPPRPSARRCPPRHRADAEERGASNGHLARPVAPEHGRPRALCPEG